MQLADSRREIRQADASTYALRSRVLRHVHLLQNAVDESTNSTGRELTDGFVDANNASRMQHLVALLLRVKYLDLGLYHERISIPPIELNLAEQSHANIGNHAICETLSVEPSGV